MLLKIDFAQKLWENNGFTVKITDAPKDAQTFDKMMIVFSDESKKMIRRVIFFSNKENKIIAEF